jgi:hypothetical protein
MKRAKSEQRKTAELIARQRNIKVSSAQAGLRRAAKSGKPYSGSGLTKYAAAKARKAVREIKQQIVYGWRKTKPEKKKAGPQPRKRSGQFKTYSSGDKRVVSVHGEFNFYGSDKRTRAIRFELDGEDLNRFLNAPTPEDAAEVLKNSDAGAFLGGAEKLGGSVDISIDRFTLEGRDFGANVWDAE